MKMKKLLKNSSLIFDYLRTLKFVPTYMSVTPQQTLVEKNITGLGYSIQNSGGNKARVKVGSQRQDMKQMLILSYYSMPLCPVFLLEGCLAIFLQSQINKFERPPIGTTMGVKQLTEVTKGFAELLYNEHVFTKSIKPETIVQRLSFFVERGFLETSDDKEVFTIISAKFMNYCRFFMELIHPLVDTYLTVLIGIYQIAGKHLSLMEETLIQELHISIKQMYSQNVLPFLHSCLIEIIQTAIDRYKQLGYLQSSSYSNSQGSQTTFLHSPFECKEEVAMKLK